MTTTSKYSVEYRDKDGDLKQYLTPFISDIGWEWNRVGGCGRCNITLAMNYRKITFATMDDIQIRVQDLVNGGTKLVYRGWVASAKPTTDGSGGDKIQLDVRGYFDLLKFIVVQDTGDEKEYTSQLVSATVTNIVDTFVTPNSDITKGTIDAAGFNADSLKFKTSVAAALETCADLEGGVEYGVDEDLVFFWEDEGTTVSHKFIVGNDISSLKRQLIFDKLVNKIYFEGGKVAGVKYLRTATASDSIAAYFLSEKVVSNSSITTQSVADQYLSALLDENGEPKEKFTVVIPETDLRLEDTLPLGKISLYDADHDAGAASAGVWGAASPAGGSGFVWGDTAGGGSNKIWGGGSGALQLQVDSIKYELSETPGKFKLSITTGDTDNRFAAKIKQIENILESVRQAV